MLQVIDHFVALIERILFSKRRHDSRPGPGPAR